MQIIVNGEKRSFEPSDNRLTLLALLEKLGYTQKSFAVAVNLHCIHRHLYGTTELQENDAVEVLSPMQGG